MTSSLINTRDDLDALIGTQQHAEFLAFLRGSMTRKQDTATYPDGYGQPGYTGAAVVPVWADVEDLSTIDRFGFVKADFL